jgi:hypothetical protein
MATQKRSLTIRPTLVWGFKAKRDRVTDCKASAAAPRSVDSALTDEHERQ